MLQVHLSDGRTLRFDLQDEQQAAAWLEQSRSGAFQASVRGLTIQHNGVQYSLPRPTGFKRLWLFAESLDPDTDQRFKGGERIVIQADDMRVVLMAHDAQRAARVSLSKPGTQCYNPTDRER